jgi:3-hydroxybutyryl-CoA dehydrogenase
MKVCIAASQEQQSELASRFNGECAAIQWVNNTASLLQAEADFLIDCTFSGNELPQTNTPLLVHAPALTLRSMQAGKKVARFCAWNTFLKRPVWEVAVLDGTESEWLIIVMNTLGIAILPVKDELGLVAPRIVSHVINEAYCTWLSGVSTKEEIDLAMKLGTNYPYGPFEWCTKIGAAHIHHLLQSLSMQDIFVQE